MFTNTTDIRQTIVDFINTNFLMGTQSVRFTDEDSFIQKGIIDSTGVLELVNFIQGTFDIKINDEDLLPENLDSVKNITQFIQMKKS